MGHNIALSDMTPPSNCGLWYIVGGHLARCIPGSPPSDGLFLSCNLWEYRGALPWERGHQPEKGRDLSGLGLCSKAICRWKLL